MSQTATSLEARLRQGYENFDKGDLDAIRGDFAPDTVWHSGGSNILTGDYKGIDDVFAYFMKIVQETGGTFKNEVHDVLANETHGVALVRSSATRNGKTLDTNTVHVAHFNSEGQISESWIIPEEFEKANDFWS